MSKPGLFSVNVDELQYHILPGHFGPGFAGTALYNSIFAYWKSFWEEVMLENGTTERIDSYEFLRADFVAAICKGDVVVGMHLYSVLNFDQANISSHPYFRGESEVLFLKALRECGTMSALSQEYLTVNREWRKSKIGFSMAPIVVGLGYEIQKSLQIDSSLGRCRQDNGVNRLMTDVGGRTVLEGIMMYNTPTDFCHVPLAEMRSHPDTATQQRIQNLWLRRHDWTGRTHPQTEDQGQTINIKTAV